MGKAVSRSEALTGYLRIFVVVLTVLAGLFTASAGAREMPFTQEDRDRLVRVEAKVEALEKRMDEGFRSTDRRIDDLRDEVRDVKDFMLWGFGILFGGMGLLIGFVIWDRRTALAPAVKKNKELEEKEERLEKALREYAREEPRLAEILKEVGIC